jgi:hypothetical protein
MFIFLGIIQLGFIFNAYVTVSNATREGAREASIYVYDHNQSQGANDGARLTRARQAVKNTMGLLPNAPPALSDSDITASYSNPWAAPATSDRKGWHVTIRVNYHLTMLIPLIGQLMPKDAGGRMPINGEVTMVIN